MVIAAQATQEVEVTGDENLVPFATTEVDANGVLMIDITRSYCTQSR